MSMVIRMKIRIASRERLIESLDELDLQYAENGEGVITISRAKNPKVGSDIVLTRNARDESYSAVTRNRQGQKAIQAILTKYRLLETVDLLNEAGFSVENMDEIDVWNPKEVAITASFPD